MERFEFDSKTGANNNRKNGFTRRGALEITPDFITFYTARAPLLLMEIKGPAGADRGGAILDKATARKLGAALLDWTMPEKSLRARLGDLLAAAEIVSAAIRGAYCDDCAGEKDLPFPLNHRVYGICPHCGEGERFVNEP